MNLETVKKKFGTLQPRDKRAIKLAVVGVVVILGYAQVLTPWMQSWAETRSALAAE